ATSSMMTALANGSTAIVPVTEIAEAVALREKNPDWLLAGEREGLRIGPEQTGSVDFDLGNSPREFTPEKVRGKTIAMTTTNGTRALQACAGAKVVLIGSFLALRPIANWIIKEPPCNLVLVCSGTFEQAALEDTLAAGALCEKIWVHYAGGLVSDAAEIARRIYPLMQMDLIGAMNHARNGKKLLSNAALRSDVWFCLQRETLNFLAQFKDGHVRKIESEIKTPAD
ncbi:MAG: 2-phosphosulfolactate phosphatase, partial [Verrucomicrobiota bacterium]